MSLAVEKRKQTEEVIAENEPEYPSSLKKRMISANPLQFLKRDVIYSNHHSPSPPAAHQIPVPKPQPQAERLDLQEKAKPSGLEISAPRTKNSIHDLQQSEYQNP